jgi:hypothetical protein
VRWLSSSTLQILSSTQHNFISRLFDNPPVSEVLQTLLALLQSGTESELQAVLTSTDKKNSMARVRERTIPTERPQLVGEVIANFADRGCHVVSVTDPYGRNLGFLDRSRYFSFK